MNRIEGNSMNSIKNRCMHGVIDNGVNGIVNGLAHAAGRHSKPQFDDVPRYAVAWAGGVSGSAVAVWRELRARATTWLNRRESSSTVGVAVPFCQAAKVAGVTPISWARRLAGVFDSSMAPERSRMPLISGSALTFTESLINFGYVVVINTTTNNLLKTGKPSKWTKNLQ